jgi:hypothetical protein
LAEFEFASSLRAVHAATTPSNAPDRHAAGFWPNSAQLAVTEAEGVLLIDPGVVARFSAAVLGDGLELRTGERSERPALRTQLAFRRLRAGVQHGARRQQPFDHRVFSVAGLSCAGVSG